MNQFGRDLGFALRLMRKSWAFAAATICIIALGIGAVTAIFTIVYNVMLKPLDYREPERLVSIWTSLPRLNLPRTLVSSADYRDWRAANHVFDDIALVRGIGNFNLIGAGEPERLQAARVSASLFRVLGVPAMIGRTFTDGEDTIGNEDVAVLSHGLWLRRFGGDRSIVGRMINLSGRKFTVVGVMPASFSYPSSDFQLWVPLTVNPREWTRTAGGFDYLSVARLKAGVPIEQAQREMSALAHRIWRETSGKNSAPDVVLEPMLDSIVRPVHGALSLLLAAVGVLLLIACLNVANLLAARAARRGGEFAVRLALGASRARLISQIVAEVLPIVVTAGAVGVVLAVLAVRAFVAAAPQGIPRIDAVHVSTPVMLFAMGSLVVAALIASIFPASEAWQSDFTTVVKEGSRSAAGGTRQRRIRTALVVAQIAFAVPLLTGSGILMRSFVRLLNVDSGINAQGVLSMLLAIPRSKYPGDQPVAAFETRVLAAVRAVPGVEAAGMVNRLPLAGTGQVGTLELDNGDSRPTKINVDSRLATPGYFETLRIPLIRGRTFTMQDDSAARYVAVIDERIAQSAWPGQNVIGKRLRVPGEAWFEVVGVVGHIRHEGLDTDPRPQVYWSYLQRPQDRMALVVRGNAPPMSLFPAVKQAIRSVDRDQPVYDVRTMSEVIDRTLATRRATMMLLAVFGAAALLLASVGVYAIVAFGVAQRMREFGIRMALGADRRSVTSLVVRQGARIALGGTVIGLLVSAAAAGALKALVFETSPRDLSTFTVAAVVLLGVAVIASYLPARRAGRVEPALSLRAE